MKNTERIRPDSEGWWWRHYRGRNGDEWEIGKAKMIYWADAGEPVQERVLAWGAGGCQTRCDYINLRTDDGTRWFKATPPETAQKSMNQDHVEALFDIADILAIPTGATPGQIVDTFRERQPTGVEARVCQDIAARQRLGIAKYGCTVGANKGDLKYWMQNLFEEILDASIYLKRAIIELENAEHHKTPNPSDG